jgi:hypothetical protein
VKYLSSSPKSSAQLEPGPRTATRNVGRCWWSSVIIECILCGWEDGWHEGCWSRPCSEELRYHLFSRSSECRAFKRLPRFFFHLAARCTGHKSAQVSCGVSPVANAASRVQAAVRGRSLTNTDLDRGAVGQRPPTSTRRRTAPKPRGSSCRRGGFDKAAGRRRRFNPTSTRPKPVTRTSSTTSNRDALS